jgi:glycosyltransferase involved in cell wall biosynthesis
MREASALLFKSNRENMNYLKLSIIIPTWNRKKKLIKLIKNITYKIKKEKIKYEILICDSYSIDGSQNEMNKYFGKNKKILYKNIKQNNIAAKRNIGIKSSKYNNILLLDDDCVPIKNFFKILKQTLNQNEFDTIYCGQYYTSVKFIEKSNYYNFRDKKNLKISNMKKIDIKNIITGCCFFNKKNIINKLLFNKEIKGYGLEDVEWAYRLRLKKFKFLLTSAMVDHQETSQNIQSYALKWYILSRDSMPTILKQKKLHILPTNTQLFENIFAQPFLGLIVKLLIIFLGIPLSVFLKKYLYFSDSIKYLFSKNLFSLLLKLYYARGAFDRNKEHNNRWYESGYK